MAEKNWGKRDGAGKPDGRSIHIDTVSSVCGCRRNKAWLQYVSGSKDCHRNTRRAEAIRSGRDCTQEYADPGINGEESVFGNTKKQKDQGGEEYVLKTEYTRKINKSSLVITPEKDYETEKDCIEMFRYNQIPYFLNMELQKRNTALQFCYDITGRRSLEQLLEYKSLDYFMLHRILQSLDQACVQAEDFMLTENDMILEPEFVFADHHTEQMSYCYLPGNQVDICGQFKAFMEYLLKTLDHKDEQAVQFGYSIYQQVVEEQTALHDVLKQEMQGKNERKYVMFEQSQPVQYVKEELQQQTVSEINSIRTKEQEAKDYEKRDEYLVWKQVSEDTVEREDTFYPSSEKNNRTGKTCLQGQYAQELSEQEMPGLQKELQRELQKEFPKELQKELPKELQTDQQNEKCNKRKQTKQERYAKKTDQDLQVYKEGQVSKIQQKETLRRQAAEKLKQMLRKKIYTDSLKDAQEDTVFEADEEEMVYSNPTVCLIPETGDIQNRFVYQGADRARDFQCKNGKMMIGSDLQECDICIPLPMVSRVHARVVIDAQGTFLEDMNSTNGTYVNGELLQYKERHMLQKGDIISLAGESYSFH